MIEIAFLKVSGHTVYGYLNVGSLEAFRPYYDRFRKFILRRYENWDGEWWIDVSARLLRAYFGSDGAGYTLCRAPIMSCDFSLSPYSYHLRLLDAGLKGLDLSHDDREVYRI